MIDWLIALSQLDNYSAIMSDVQKTYNGVYVAKADRPDNKEGLTLFGDFFFYWLKMIIEELEILENYSTFTNPKKSYIER